MSENVNDANYVATIDEVREETMAKFHLSCLCSLTFEPLESELDHTTGLCAPF
ncbi:MAG: hypothetical protein JW776_05535 [Candidatus Lokiarchaeota archaeon]|nr:hypothetical protein [Candidatus Lokiarchaeota archaeon]